MASREFDSLADGAKASDLTRTLGEDANEVSKSLPRGSIDGKTTDSSSRKYAPRDHKVPNSPTPLEAGAGLSEPPREQAKSAAGVEEAGAVTRDGIDHSKMESHKGDFHSGHDAQESKTPAKQASKPDNDDEDDDDETSGQFQLVKKSVYKPPKKGSILQRLAGIAGGGGSKSKYVIPPSDPGAAITASLNGPGGEQESGGGATSRNDRDGLEDVDIDDSTAIESTASAILVEEEEPIDVAIDHSLDNRHTAPLVQESQNPVSPVKAAQQLVLDDAHGYGEDSFTTEAAALQEPPQVVIHSGESDSETGFATINPVIAARRKLHGPARSATVASADASPFLLEIPMPSSSERSSDSTATHPSSLLVINALGASGLLKVEKFGTQSTLLELQLCSRRSKSEDPDLNSQPSVMRTNLHKKGGSEAQWNQQFTTALESKQEQFIRASVKTNNRILVGLAEVPLNKVGDLFYDQHFPLYRPEEDATDDAMLESRTTTNESEFGSPAGSLHLQLKIVDASNGLASPAAVPRLHLPFPTASEPRAASKILQNSSERREIRPELTTGSLLYKVPYHRSSVVGYTAIPRRVWVSVIEDNDGERLITWGDPIASTTSSSKKVSSLDLSLVTEIREGHDTKAFEAHKTSTVVKEKEKCFSLLSKSRTLDLVAASKEEATIWVTGLRELLFPTTSTSARDSLTSARTIQDYRRAALSSARSNGVVDTTGSDPAKKKKQQLAVWRSQVFDLARRNDVDAIASCLHDGCPIDLLETGTGDTLLVIACREGNAPLVELCLSWRAKNDPHPEFGDTALQVAVAHRHADCLKLLLLAAAKSDMDSEIVNHIDSNSDAPLHVAARNGDFACLQHLLLHGADICVVDEIGRTPLHCAVSTAHQGGADCVAYLLDVGGDSVLNLGDHEGDTPLHYASLAGNERAVKLLLESAADVFAINLNGETPFDVAMREQHQQCADLIAPYVTNAATNVLTDQLVGGPVESDRDHGELQPDQSDEEQEEEESAHYRRHRGRHHRRHMEELSEAGDDDNLSEYGNSSVSDREVAYDSSDHSSSSLYGSSSRVHSQSEDDQQRSWSEAERAYNSVQDDRSRSHILEPPSDWRHSAPTITPALSASEQIRAALARHQRSLSVTSCRRPPMSARSALDGGFKRNMSLSAFSSHYNSAGASEWSPPRDEQQPLYWVNGRQVMTERLDRSDADHQTHRLHRFQSHINRDGYHTARSYDPATYGSNSHRTRSQSEDIPGPGWGYRANSQAWASYNRSQTNEDLYCTNSAYSPSAWTTEQGDFTPLNLDQWAKRPATAGSVSIAPCWDLLYTEDGYPYYVNQQTGISQWEKPPDAEIAPPATQVTSSTSILTCGPDEIIRMRLARARRQQSMPATVIHSYETAVNDQKVAQERDETGSSTPCSASSAIATTSTHRSEPVETSLPSGAIPTESFAGNAAPEPGSESSVQPAAPPTVALSSLESKYESRTGVKLSIDIASPPSKEHVRPAFVPSPRSKVVSEPLNPRQTVSDGTSEIVNPNDGIFQKSRASSPRGRSKNVSLIELKRANNLAVALASFKINDRYEKIVDGIITMDETAISAPLLACLQRFFPTEQERDALQRFSGDVSTLGKPERFFFLLFQVPSVQTRIDMFLYKLEFGRMKQTLLGRIVVVKRACRDLAENFGFVQAINRFFAKHQEQRSLALLDKSRDVFKLQFLAEADEKLASFRGDLVKAANVDTTDLQLQLNRLLAGRRTIQAFVDQRGPVARRLDGSRRVNEDADDKAASAAHDTLERFLLETRKPMSDVEEEFESMEQWSDKLLAVFGESKASCRLAGLVECIVRLL